MGNYSLDSNFIAKLLKKHPGNQSLIERFRSELQKNSVFIICPIVFYEIKRELILKKAATQESAFQRLVEGMEWREFSAPIWERASQLWSTLREGGRSHNDADVLIAAHALEHEAVIVTNDVGHFQNIGVSVVSWSA